jgi:hypothetical protein
MIHINKLNQNLIHGSSAALMKRYVSGWELFALRSSMLINDTTSRTKPTHGIASITVGRLRQGKKKVPLRDIYSVFPNKSLIVKWSWDILR